MSATGILRIQRAERRTRRDRLRPTEGTLAPARRKSPHGLEAARSTSPVRHVRRSNGEKGVALATSEGRLISPAVFGKGDFIFSGDSNYLVSLKGGIARFYRLDPKRAPAFAMECLRERPSSAVYSVRLAGVAGIAVLAEDGLYELDPADKAKARWQELGPREKFESMLFSPPARTRAGFFWLGEHNGKLSLLKAASKNQPLERVEVDRQKLPAHPRTRSALPGVMRQKQDPNAKTPICTNSDCLTADRREVAGRVMANARDLS